MNHPIYLDNNATLPVDTTVIKKILEAEGLVGNPSSVHSFGRHVRSQIESARMKLATALNIAPANLLFTSGGSEGNNTILKTFQGKPLWISAVEHESVHVVCPHRQILPVDANGVINLSAMNNLLAANPGPGLVSVMCANNETGVLQPIEEVVKIAKTHGYFVHTDACQAFGKMPLDLQALGVDYATLSAHKMGGPIGVGAIYVKDKVPFEPLIMGGGQEKSRRAGTQNVALIMGFAEALNAFTFDQWDLLNSKRDWVIEQVKAICEDVRVFSQGAKCLPNTICMTMPGVHFETQVMVFDLEGIAVSAGAACSSGKMDISRVLLNMGISEDEASCAIRISFSPRTTTPDLIRFVDVWGQIYRQTRPNIQTIIEQVI